jgi:predicted permease
MLGVLAVTAPIFIVIAIGFAAVASGLFAREAVRVLGRFVIQFALPALLFKALSERSFAEVMNLDYLLAYAAGSLAVMAAGVAVAYRLRRKDLAASTLHGLGMSMSNSGFIGFPVALQVLGPPAAVALALSMIVENLLMLPLALALADSGAGDGRRWHAVVLQSLLRLATNPIILAITAGFALALLDAPPPAPVARAIDMLAMACGPVALFVIGGTLAGQRIRGMLGDVGLVVAGKLLLHPMAVLAAFLLVRPVDPPLFAAALIYASAPMLSIYPIIGQKYGHEGMCAAALLAATAASFLSVSALLWLVGASGMLAVGP